MLIKVVLTFYLTSHVAQLCNKINMDSNSYCQGLQVMV